MKCKSCNDRWDSGPWPCEKCLICIFRQTVKRLQNPPKYHTGKRGFRYEVNHDGL